MKERTSTPFWLWINLLSLDAPLVALAWQDFLARCYPIVLHPSDRLVLGLTVWVIYLADRLIDTCHPTTENESARHRFCRQYPTAAKALFTSVLSADAAVALIWLRPDLMLDGLFAGTAVVFYLIVFAWRRLGGSNWKQPCAAILFTAGVFLVANTDIATPWRMLMWPAAAFCALCLENLMLIERWEQGRTTARTWIWIIAIVSLCAAFEDSRWYAAVAVSAVGLALLDFRSRKISGNALRVLADAVLLTPLLFR